MSLNSILWHEHTKCVKSLTAHQVHCTWSACRTVLACSPLMQQCVCRTFRKAGTIDPAMYSHQDSLELGPAVNPRRRLPFKLHCSNIGYQILLKQGWQEGKGLGCGAKGRADPYIPTHQCGKDAHLGLGCMRYKDILTGKGAEDEIRVCFCPLLTSSMMCLCKATLLVSVLVHAPARLAVALVCPYLPALKSLHLSIVVFVWWSISYAPPAINSNLLPPPEMC